MQRQDVKLLSGTVRNVPSFRQIKEVAFATSYFFCQIDALRKRGSPNPLVPAAVVQGQGCQFVYVGRQGREGPQGKYLSVERVQAG